MKKNRFKKVIATMLSSVFIMGALAGCGGGDGGDTNNDTTSSGDNQTTSSESNNSKETSSGKKKVVTFGTHQSGLPTSGIVQELAEDFKEETGIEIDFQISPDAQWRDLLQVKLDSKEAQDIFCADTPINLASSVRMDQFCVPLTDEEWVDRIDDSVIPAISIDDEVYGITFPGKKMYFYVYNKEIFEECDVEIPTNYEEFKEVCQTLLDAGYTPIYEGTTNGWHQVLPLFETGGMYQQNDPDLYEKLNKNEMDFDDIPELLTIIEQLQECAELGYFGKDYLSNTMENSKEALANEKAVMCIQESAFRNEVAEEFPDFDADKLGIFIMPWGDNQVIGINPASNAYFINKESKNAEEAKMFFEFLARPENLQKRLDGQANLSEVCWPEIPGRYSEEDQEFIDNAEKDLVVQVGVNYIDNQWMDIGKDLEAMYTGAYKPEQVLEKLMERREKQAKLQKDPSWD